MPECLERSEKIRLRPVGGKAIVGSDTKKILCTFPRTLIERLDLEADRLALDRVSLIRFLVSEALMEREREKERQEAATQ